MAKTPRKIADKRARKIVGKLAPKGTDKATDKPADNPAGEPARETSSKSPPRELATILDFIRYAATRFAAANLAYGQGTFSPVEEATFLVAEALGLPVDGVDSFLPARMTAAECRHIFSLIDKRIRLRTPAAYLLNCAYLQGTRFYIDERVIVPRSYLAEILYGELFTNEEPLLDRHAVRHVLELCTGSGCLGVLACDIFPNAQVDATDISEAALEVAAINVATHDLKARVTLWKGDLFQPIADTTYDLILANPPYPLESELEVVLPTLTRLFGPGGSHRLDWLARE